jgi:chromosome segregation ATPase
MYAICLLLLSGLPLVAIETRAGDASQQRSPAAQTVAAEANNREAKIVSNVLLTALEEKLKSLKQQAEQAQQLSDADAGETAAAVAAFINQRINALERMMALIEQRQAMQTEVDAYQKRLRDLQQKISGNKKSLDEISLE